MSLATAAAGPQLGIVACEHSGDLLGCELMTILRRHCPQVRFVGVGGPRMMAAGCQSLVPMERLATMGILAPLMRLPSLLSARRRLIRHFLADPPRLFIGVDAPDFNLGLARALYLRGIATAHCVSPSVWAWRRGRLNRIAGRVDMMLTLFPFETEWYRRAGIPVRCIGHPLADSLQPPEDPTGLRRNLEIAPDGPLIALLPGSRAGEVKRLGRLFVRTARWCAARRPDWKFAAAAIDSNCLGIWKHILSESGDDLPLQLLSGQSQQLMGAADAILAGLGTVTLEGLLLGKPMVTAWQTDALSFALLDRMVRIPYKALPNVLAGERLVPEFLQRAATPERLGAALLEIVDSDKAVAAARQRRFAELAASLRCDRASIVAEALLPLLGADARGD